MKTWKTPSSKSLSGLMAVVLAVGFLSGASRPGLLQSGVLGTVKKSSMVKAVGVHRHLKGWVRSSAMQAGILCSARRRVLQLLLLHDS